MHTTWLSKYANMSFGVPLLDNPDGSMQLAIYLNVGVIYDDISMHRVEIDHPELDGCWYITVANDEVEFFVDVFTGLAPAIKEYSDDQIESYLSPLNTKRLKPLYLELNNRLTNKNNPV
jgi:hypothetical protein